MLAPCGEVVLPDIENNKVQLHDRGGKRHICIKNLCSMKDKERR